MVRTGTWDVIRYSSDSPVKQMPDARAEDEQRDIDDDAS